LRKHDKRDHLRAGATMDIVTPSIEAYAFAHTQPEPALLVELAEETKRTRTDFGMLCGRLEGRFLKFLAQLLSARRVLELGLFTGYSALSMAEGMPNDGQLISCDIDPRAEEFALRYIKRSPHGHKISIRVGPALDTIASLQGPFDLVFIDADKVNYVNYYRAVLPLLRPGGVIAIDNTLWSGRVLDPKDESDRTIDALNKAILADAGVENVLIAIRDGLHLVRKRGG
jgi:caffeoyl-CoA O-methyltransferase